jgi:glycosyltransferase involved in cell wall biosynthesis
MLATVVIPCYNERNSIRETVEKIYLIFSKNNIDNIEVIVVNDGSNDGTDKILNSLADEYKLRNFQVLHHTRIKAMAHHLKQE